MNDILTSSNTSTNSLKEIFEAITPQNIKDIPILRDAMDIFIDHLQENSRIAININEIYDNAYDPFDKEYIQDSKKELRDAILSVYMVSLYNSITKAQSDQVVVDKLKDLGLDDVFLSQDTSRILNDEFFFTNKEFKEKKGTETAIEYSYNLSQFLQSVEGGGEFKLTEVQPFHFLTEGAIFKEMYENIVKPLAHPLGFTYFYTQVIEENLQDIYGVTTTYDVRSVEIRGIDGSFDVFTPDADDTGVQLDFLSRINPLTNELFTLAEYTNQVTVFTNKVVSEFTEGPVQGRDLRTILFVDGTFIARYTNPFEVLYTTYQSWLEGTNIPIKEYNGHYSVFADYTVDYVFEYSDTLEFFETTQFDETYNMNDTDNIDDGFEIDMVLDGGLYLNSTDNFYFHTSDGYYLISSPNP